MLFPDGHLPSRRWRPVGWVLVVIAAGWASQGLQRATTVTGGLTNALAAAHVTYPNPLGFLPRHGWYSDLLKAIFVLAIVTGLLVIASVFVRRRGASTELRKQLAWLGYVGAMTALWAAVLTLSAVAAPGPANGWLGTMIWGFLTLTPVAGIPAACAVAVLRYRLYEIDKVISRTLAYAIVTGRCWRVRRAGAAGHRGASAAVPQHGRGRGVHAGRRRAVHPAAVPGAAAGGPPVQPDPV